MRASAPFVFLFVLSFSRLASSQPVSQPASQPVPQPVTSGAVGGLRWSVGAGIETLSLRDIARTSRPVTASPIAWEGRGPALRARLSWENPRRLHQVDFGGSLAGGFEYSSPLRSQATHDDDRARYFDARYEYRRYPFRDLLLRGVDLGFGVEALGARTSFARHIEPSIEVNESRTNAGIGGSIAARVRRWDRVRAELAWTNGLVIGRRREDWSSGAVASGGGGGWLTTLAAQADVRLTRGSTLFFNYTGSGEAFLASHRSYAIGRRRLAMGVTYGR
jgi:hypothetical protein